MSAIVSTYTGDLDRALRAGREAVELAAGYDQGLFKGIPGTCLAFALMELGDADQARSVALTAAGGTDLQLLPRRGRAMTCEVLARAEPALGHLGAAEAWAREAKATARNPELAVEVAIAHRASARVLLARGDAET